MKRTYLAIAGLPLLVVLAGCSEGSKPAAVQKEPEKPPELVAGQRALQQMYITARGWSRDARLLRLEDADLKDVKPAGGKAAAWECTFVDEPRRKARRFTYSAAKGVSSIAEEPWAPGVKNWVFPIQDAQTDSVAAYELAMKKGAEIAQKNPGKPVRCTLEWPKRLTAPVWRVYWGDSVETSAGTILVNAKNGEYLKTEH